MDCLRKRHRKHAAANASRKRGAGLSKVDSAEPLKVTREAGVETHITGELKVDIPAEMLVFQHAVVVVVPKVGETRPPVNNRPFRPPAILHVRIGSLGVHPGHEAGHGPEIRIDTTMGDGITQIPRLSGKVGFDHGTAQATFSRISVLRTHSQEAHRVSAT